MRTVRVLIESQKWEPSGVLWKVRNENCQGSYGKSEMRMDVLREAKKEKKSKEKEIQAEKSKKKEKKSSLKKAGKIQWQKQIGVSLLLVLGGSLAGLLLLLLVFCLPTENMRFHVWQSLPTLEKEFWESEVFLENEATLTGSFTDCLMLEHAVYTTEAHSLLEQVLYMYRGESGTGDGWAPGFSLVDYLENVEQPREVTYARYWHGYLVILKPLLLFMDVASIRMLAAAVQLLLAGGIAMLCGRRKETLLGMAFLVSLPFLYVFTLYFSLSLSICYYLMTIAVICQLICHEKLQQKGYYGFFFLIVGMATAYFDFLTYPLITLGYPLCISLYLSADRWKEGLKKCIVYSLQWGFGYLGLWAMKWILTDVLTGGGVIKDAAATLFTRTESAEGYSKLSGFFAVCMQNASAYRSRAFYVLVLGTFLALAVWLVLQKKHTGKHFRPARQLEQGLTCFVVALYPFVWLFLTQNHSQQHWMYTCKILAVTVFAGICGIGKGFRKEDACDFPA